MHYTDEWLDSLRLMGDPEPDRIVAELHANGEIDEVNQILSTLLRNNQVVPLELPDNIEFWLRAHWRLPAWADPARIERGTQFFVEYGVPISLILPTAALIECYAAQKGVKVLCTTYRLGQNPYRRVAETAQFVLNIMSPGALSPEGMGIPTILKVRLMHSAIRVLMRHKNHWNGAEMGVPVCQEDMLGSLLAFSCSVLRYMERLHMTFTAEEAEDYYYMWRVIGEMLGVKPEIIPTTLTAAYELAEVIKRRQQGPSPEGVKMTAAVLEMFAELIPGQMFDGIVPAVIRHLVGDQIADWMEIPRTHWTKLFAYDEPLIDFLDFLDRKTGKLADVVDRLGLAFLSRQAIAGTDYQRTAFTIPEELHLAWVERGKMK
jgi:hypothetical protein